MEQKAELLDVLCELLGCSYLSELSNLSPASALGKALSARLDGISAEDYPLCEWCEALCYLAPGVEASAETAKAAKALLKAQFSG